MNLDKSLTDCEFCAVDLETTGISPFKDKIIEIGAVSFYLNRESNKKYSTLINPEIPISENAYNIHGISEKMVINAPLFKDISKSFLEFLQNKILVIQNPKFDLSFIEMECMKMGIKFPMSMSFDTVTLSKKVLTELPNHKLGTLCRYLNLDLNYHRALDDAIGCMEVFKHVINRIDPGSIMTLKELKKFQGNVDKSGIIAEVSAKSIRGVKIKKNDVLNIKYRDNAGNITERKIIVYQIYKKGGSNILYGYCHLRNDIRYFKTSRIIEISK